MSEPCWVCGQDPHEPVEGHAYATESEAFAWHMAQPQGETVWPLVDGEPLGGHL